MLAAEVRIMNELRVLYLWNTAGALSPVGDWLIDHGHKAKILMRSDYDLFGNTSISKAAHMVHSGNEYFAETVKQLMIFNPTHIHINANLPSLVLARLLRPFTPIVFHYHGDEVRYRSTSHPEMILADKVIVSTPDLCRYGEWYDRPVDKMFHYRGGRKKGTAVMFYATFFTKDLRKHAQEWCDERNIELTIIEREKGEGIPYNEMPSFLSKYEYFIDFKGVGDPETISRLAIEAIACECKVVSDADPSNILISYDFPKPEKYYDLYISMKQPAFSLKRAFACIRGLVRWFSGELTRLPVPRDSI